ncbi:GATA-type zinc finger protein 1-like [Asterias rubens]|uniref:GATA-type zinc finger protein 1-like n=1 Tax=Asterias rubens TaxID=7604 RepID=UPI001455CE7F|nr:GATA-type zinc finger protein 1-like [Asterias rubens]
MSCRYDWSSKLSEFERYRGFFPSYVDDQLDFSTDTTVGDVHADADVANDGQGSINSLFRPKETAQPKKKFTGISEDGEGHTSYTSSGGSASSSGGASTRDCSGKTKRRVRKAKTPRRGAQSKDPRFRGVTFCVETQLCQEKRQKSQLLIRSFYSMKKNRSQETKSVSKRRSIYVDSTTSGSERESATMPRHIAIPYVGIPNFGVKQCASCCTKRTPLWRDAEDGTPLCNACGIRYKKYRVRCISCWSIPKKTDKSCQDCARCGNKFRIIIPKRSRVC